MTTSTDTPRDADRAAAAAGAAGPRATVPAAAQPPRRRAFSPISVLIIAVLGGMVLYYADVFPRTPRVAIVTSGEGPYWDPVIAGAEEAARRSDVKLSVIRSKSEIGTQSQHIQALLREKLSGIAVSPLDPEFQSTVLADVAAQTTLVTFDSDSPVARRLCFVGTDNYGAGRLCGEAVKRAIPDGGEVVICMGFPNKDNTLRRRQGVIDELLDRPVDPQHRSDPLDEPVKGERYTVVATLTDEGDREKAKALAAQAFATRPNVKCFVGLVSYSAPTVAQAMKEAGKTGQAKVVSFDVDERTLAGIGEGTIDATVMQDQFGLGFHAVRILAAEARGNRGELPAYQTHVLPCRLVTKDNLEQTRRDLANPGRNPASPEARPAPRPADPASGPTTTTTASLPPA